MEIVFIGAVLVVGICLFGFFRRTPKSRISLFEIEKAELIEQLTEAEIDGELHHELAFPVLFVWALNCMVRALPKTLSIYKGRELTYEEEWYVRFECLTYLFFNSDVWAHSFGQSDKARAAFEKRVIHDLLDSAFTAKDESLSDVIEDRLDEYTQSYQSKSAMNNPAGVLLNHLKFLADTGSVNTDSAWAPYDAFAHVIDWTMVQQMQSFYLLLDCCRALFTADRDWRNIPDADCKNILISTINAARPLDFSTQKPPKEPVRA